MISFRAATRDDVVTLVRMLADDDLGAEREAAADPLPSVYDDAFSAIDDDPNNELLVAEEGGTIAGFLQITYIPYLTYQGRPRALIESVRTRSDRRGRGVGAALVAEAIDRARARHCHLVQLTTDKQRPDAIRFYEGLGFSATHEGFKLHLDS